MHRSAWKEKLATRVPRRLGLKWRLKELKKKEPTQKQPSEVPDLIHRVPSEGAARPSPM
jgi:hypothetical protein